MNFTKLLFISLLLLSCGQKTEQKEQDQTLSENMEDLIEQEPEIIDSFKGVAITNPQILIPNVYRDESGKDLSQLDDSWKELYFDESENKWLVDKASFKISRDFDECAGDSVTFVLSARKAILFFKGIETPLNEIKTVMPIVQTMAPERQFDFKFNSEEYSLTAKGKVKEYGGPYFSSEEIAGFEDEIYQDYLIDDYSLSLNKKGDRSQEIIGLKELAFICPQLLWIGDLDMDGKPDFIFDTAEENRTYNVELHLSSQAEDDKYIIKVAEVYSSNDC